MFVSLAFFAPKKPTDIFEGWAEVYYTYSLETEFESQKLGDGTLVFCRSDKVKILPQDYFAISLTVSVESWQRAQGFFEFNTLVAEEGANFVSELVFCPSLLGGVLVCGKKVNAQVAFVGEQVKIGFPMIIGAF